jgi:gluconate 5-dehydrogenase
MDSWWDLSGRRVLIAGAGGFGQALVRAFGAAGCRLFVVDQDKDRLAELPPDPRRVTTEVADLSEQASCESVVSQAVEAMGGIDVLVHAVGINRRVPVEEITADDWHDIMTVNAASCLWLGRAAGRHMRERGDGRMVFISSVSGLLAHPKHGAYAASKGALNQLLKVMAVEWAPYGVGVNAVAPGYTLTPLTADYCAVPGRMEELLARVPMGRLGEPDDIVAPVLMLASRRSAYVTGQIVYVDGGRTLD